MCRPTSLRGFVSDGELLKRCQRDIDGDTRAVKSVSGQSIYWRRSGRRDPWWICGDTGDQKRAPEDHSVSRRLFEIIRDYSRLYGCTVIRDYYEKYSMISTGCGESCMVKIYIHMINDISHVTITVIDNDNLIYIWCCCITNINVRMKRNMKFKKDV